MSMQMMKARPRETERMMVVRVLSTLLGGSQPLGLFASKTSGVCVTEEEDDEEASAAASMSLTPAVLVVSQVYTKSEQATSGRR